MIQRKERQRKNRKRKSGEKKQTLCKIFGNINTEIRQKL